MNQNRLGKSAERAAREFFGEYHRRDRSKIGSAIFGCMTQAQQPELSQTAEDVVRNRAKRLPVVPARNGFILYIAAHGLAQLDRRGIIETFQPSYRHAAV